MFFFFFKLFVRFLLPIVLLQLDDDTTYAQLSSRVEVGALAFVSRTDVSPRLHCISAQNVFKVYLSSFCGLSLAL